MSGTKRSAYNDDDPRPPAHASPSGVLVLDCEYPSVPKAADQDGKFSMMLNVKAPALVTAAPLDLVAVLDVSESMGGAKLAQVKRAMGFVVDRLGPRDRLSVVVFSDGARRIVRLRCMTEDAKAAVKRAVEAIEASGGSTNVRAGLDEVAKVLRGSKYLQNDVASVILVSGGLQSDRGDVGGVDVDLVPPFLRHTFGSGYRRTPVHTFLLGSESSAAAAAAIHNISEATGGTFSFVEDPAVIQDALARCVGGLLSVTAMDAWVQLNCVSDELNVTAMKCGRYESRVDSVEDAWVDVGELYAGEERRILCSFEVPEPDDPDQDAPSWVLEVRCTYMDVASRQHVPVEQELVPDGDEEVPGIEEVEREVLRVKAAEDMALARDAAERGAYAEAARILDARRESLSVSSPALSGDAVCTAVAAELHELSQRVSDEREYAKTGRACLLAAMSSHGLQRGSTSPVRFGCGVGSSVFATPAMRKMEKLSEMMRKQQEAPPRPPLPESGSKTGVPLGSRRRLEARLASAVPRLSMLSRYRRLLLKR